jgi:cytochrome c oxidase subunit 1
VHTINAAITIAALVVAASVVIFLYNMIVSFWRGEKAPPNPWKATTLEWQTPDTPPKHGNWGPRLHVVHRWAYDYSVPGAPDDFIPQNVPIDVQHPSGFGHGEDKDRH